MFSLIEVIIRRLLMESNDKSQFSEKAEPVVNKQAAGKMYKAFCFNCGKATEVPFEPASGRKAYCKECYSLHERGQL
jgi:CxxC-x17-CxxC domain-containing protein